ncbi:MAG: nitrophenyl compound nitroreductase subunit ArsF family protein [Candidatus Latescibacteria bacterium]|nr:nitrophenyl compound nitroreductase subunit ArsF family protein [Candidatus Latescibacterota bacterium]
MRLCTAILLTLAAAAAVAQPAPDVQTTPDVVVYYLHGDFRCKTCLMLEDMTIATVRDSFATQLEDKVLDLQVVNFMSEGNEHFEQDFQLEQQSVIVVEREAGKIVRWKNLARIWELYDRPLQFAAYVAGETRLYLDGAPDPKP